MAKRTKLTKAKMASEIKKCAKDPVYFINNYVRIVHAKRGLIPFSTYPFQSDLLKDFVDHRYNIILKSRQLGISTLSAAYSIWMMLFRGNKSILIIATKLESAKNLLKKIKLMYKHVPEWMKIAGIKAQNQTTFELKNGSFAKAVTTSPDAGRSEALSLLIIDEAAHIENMDELWSGLAPTISTGGDVIALSSPYGVGNWFHRMCTGAEIGDNNFHLTTLPWQVHPERDEEWFDNETSNLPRREIAQEYLCSFNASGDTVIDPEDIDFVEKNCSEPSSRAGVDRNFWVWEDYKPGKRYLISCDVARGDGQDYSAFHVINIDDLEIVAEYRGKINIDNYALFILEVCRSYGDPLLVIENNNIGYAVLDKLILMNYKNIFYSKKGDSMTSEFVDPYLAETLVNVTPGFSTTMKTRPLIIAKFEEFVRNKQIKINSLRTAKEMRTFVWNNGRPQAMKGCNDDLIMSLAIACWIRDTALFQSTREDEYKRTLLDNMIFTSTKMDIRVHGQKGYRNTDNLQEKAFKSAKQYDEFLWLYKG